MALNYKSLISDSFKMTIKYRWLWLLGLFITEASVFISTDFRESKEMLTIFNSPEFWNNINALSFIKGPIVLWSIMLLALVFFFAFVSVVCKAGILYAIKQSQGNKKFNVWQMFKSGLTKFWPMLGLELAFLVPNLLFSGLFILSIVMSYTVLTYVAVGVFLLYNLFIFLFRHYSYCYLVLGNATVGDALKKGYGLFMKFWQETLLINLIKIGFYLAALIVTGIAIVLATLPFILLVFLFSMVMPWYVPFATAVLGLIAAILVLMLVKGIKSSFFYILLTKTYWELNK